MVGRSVTDYLKLAFSSYYTGQVALEAVSHRGVGSIGLIYDKTSQLLP